MLTKNIGPSGRIFRLSIGILLLAFAIWQKSWIAFALAVFTFFEAYMSWCVLYQILGKNSCPIEPKKPKK